MTDYTQFLATPDQLLPLLMVADNDDLAILVDYITDSGAGRITLAADVCNKLMVCKQVGVYHPADRKLIAHEILAFGGNTFANFYRDIRSKLSMGSVLGGEQKHISYEELVADVAKSLKAVVDPSDKVSNIELAILLKVFTQAYDQMSSEERAQLQKELGPEVTLGGTLTAAVLMAGRANGFATYQLALVVANAIAKMLLGRGLTFVGNQALVRTVSVALGPVGMALTAIWTLADLASPASRVTVPCVVQLAYMRQKALHAALNQDCPACETDNPRSARFCRDCGTALAGA